MITHFITACFLRVANNCFSRRFPIVLTAAFCCFNSFSQRSLNGLLQAEKNFAAWSSNHGTKDAFLSFADDSGIVFSNGKPVNAIEFWNTQQNSDGILNWEPRYGAVAVSGDIGFTCGPWTFKKKDTDTVAARGIYTTVWHINKKGEWKFLVDLGVRNSNWGFTISKNWPDEIADTTHYKPSIDSLLKAENKFIGMTSEMNGNNSLRKTFYKSNITQESICILNRNNQARTEMGDRVETAIDGMPTIITYKPAGYGIASSGDFGYVYGTTVINDKIDNYLRIWKKERGEWRVMAEVVRY